MPLIQQRHFVPNHIARGLRLQLNQAILERFDRGTLFRRRTTSFGGHVTLALVELGPDEREFIQNRLFFLIVCRADDTRAFKGHMLIEMRESGLADLLIDPTHREGDVDGDDRRLMSFDHEHGQPICQPVLDHPFGETRRGSVGRIEDRGEAQDDEGAGPNHRTTDRT